MKKGGQHSSSKKSSQKKKQSSLTKQKLVDFITRTAQVERKLEIVKEMLAEQETFTPASLFHRIDTARKGYVTSKDIDSFMRSQKVDLKGSDLKMLFGRINSIKSQEAVRVRQFQNFILPNQNPRLRYFTMRRPVLIPIAGEPLDQKVEWITTKLFSQIITQYSRLMETHRALLSSFDFDASHIFSMLSSNEQFITGEDLIAFVTDAGKELSTEEVGCLLRTIDRRGQGQLYTDDFKYFFATLGLKKEHEIFDELSPIPALRQSEKKVVKDRDATLKERYKDNKSYVPGMDEEGHHVLGYSKRTDSPGWLSNSRKTVGRNFQAILLGSILYPLERIQSVQQVQSSFSSQNLRNSTTIISEAIHHGRKSYFRGFLPFFSKSCLLTASVKVTELSSSTPSELWTPTDSLSLGFGMLGYIMLYPLQVVNLHMSVEVQRKRIYSNVRECLSKIKKNQGVKSLYRGFSLGSLLFSTQLVSIKYVQKRFEAESEQLSDWQKSAALLGLLTATEIILYPLQTIKKLYQINGAIGHTNSNFGIIRTIKANTFLSLFRGLSTRLSNLGLFSLLYCVLIAEE